MAEKKKLEVLNKDLEDIKNHQSEMETTITEMTEMKNTLEGINSRLHDTEKWISKLEGRVVEITDAEQKIEKRIKGN